MTKRTWLKLAAIAAGGCVVAKHLLPPSYSFAGKVAIVTGGSRGLGLELARRLGAAGASVAICSRDPDELAAAMDDLDARGIDAFAGPCDVTDRGQVAGFVRAVLARFGRIDVLINNAGVIGVGPLEHMTDEDFAAAMQTHLDGPRFFCEEVLPHMKARGEGRIVNIASIGGRINLPHALPYCASKFALVGYSEGLGAEVAKDGIRVTTVCPGMMRTGSPLNATFKGQADKEFAWFATSDLIPVASVASGDAADRILDACARGKRELIFPIAAKLAVTAHDLFRGTSLAVISLIGRLMPAPGGDGSRPRLGRDVECLTPKPVRNAHHAIGARNNERPPSRLLVGDRV